MTKRYDSAKTPRERAAIYESVSIDTAPAPLKPPVSRAFNQSLKAKVSGWGNEYP